MKTENKLDQELYARQKQLQDMQQMKKDLLEKIERIETQNESYKKEIEANQKILEIKTGKLDYILEEKESLFIKLHDEIATNKKLKKNTSFKKQKKKGFFSNWLGFLKQDDINIIETSKGTIKKNIVNNKKNLLKEFHQSDSYMSENPQFDQIDFDKIRMDIDSPDLVVKKQEKIQIEDKNQIDINDNIPVQDEQDNQKEEKTESNEDQEDSDESEDDGNDENDILQQIKVNLKAADN